MTNDNLGQNNRSGDKKKRNFGESGVVGVADEHVAKLPRSPDATPMRKSVTLAVSYTHLDVYKRQECVLTKMISHKTFKENLYPCARTIFKLSNDLSLC